MSRLIYNSYVRDLGDELIASFEGTPEQTLGSALMHFNKESLERAKRLTSGEIPAVPAVILEHAQKMLVMELPDRSSNFTVVETERGFDMWTGDGPDKYSLIN